MKNIYSFLKKDKISTQTLFIYFKVLRGKMEKTEIRENKEIMVKKEKRVVPVRGVMSALKEFKVFQIKTLKVI
mgnify:CR=1 FL=1